jgi:hypothetical protein
MATKLIRYDGVNDPQQNIVEIDLSAIPNGSAFTIDILYSCRNLTNSTQEEAGIYRYINTYAKYGSSSYAVLDERLILEFYWGSLQYESAATISGNILYLDLISTNSDSTVLFDCKLEY